MSQSAPESAPRAAHPTAVLAIVLVSYLMIIIDTTVVITGLPDIQAELDLTPTGLSWVQNAYSLAFGGLLLLGARAGDVFGRRRVLVTGLVLFTLASLVVGAAPTGAWLIAARAGQGAGAAILAPSTLALLTASFAEGAERNRAVAAYGSVAGIGTAFGLVLGGLLADLSSWRVAFAINVPIGALLVFMALRHLPAAGRRPDRRHGRLDILGAATSTVGMTALVYGTVRSADDGWSDLLTVTSLAAGIGLLAVFVLVERSAAHPVMPLHLFADRVRTGAYLARFCFIGAMITYFLFLSQFLQDVQGWTALAAGLAFLPMTLVNFAVATAVPRLTRRFGGPLLLVSGVALALLGMVWLTGLEPTSTFAVDIALPCVLVGAGQGLAFAHLTAAGISGVRPSEAGAASGVVNAFHQVGAALGLALAVTVAAAVVDTGPATTEAGQMVQRVDAAMTTASVLLALALLAVLLLVARPRQGPGAAETDASVASSLRPDPRTLAGARLTPDVAGAR